MIVMIINPLLLVWSGLSRFFFSPLFLARFTLLKSKANQSIPCRNSKQFFLSSSTAICLCIIVAFFFSYRIRQLFCNGFFTLPIILFSFLLNSFASFLDMIPCSVDATNAVLTHAHLSFLFFIKKICPYKFYSAYMLSRTPLDHLLFNSFISLLEFFFSLCLAPCLTCLCPHTPFGSK